MLSISIHMAKWNRIIQVTNVFRQFQEIQDEDLQIYSSKIRQKERRALKYETDERSIVVLFLKC